jgi:anti-anti-sigma factor
MDIEQEQQGANLQIRLSGDLDIYAAASLRTHLLTMLQQHHEIELVLNEVAEVDGAGLQMLLATKAEALRLGGILRLTGHSVAMVRALQLCRLTAYFGDPVILTREMAG